MKKVLRQELVKATLHLLANASERSSFLRFHPKMRNCPQSNGMKQTLSKIAPNFDKVVKKDKGKASSINHIQISIFLLHSLFCAWFTTSLQKVG